LKLSVIAEHIGATLKGDPDCEIDGVASLHRAQGGDLTFLSGSRYLDSLATTGASAVIMSSTHYSPGLGLHCLLVENPYAAYAYAAQRIHPLPTFEPGVHPTAVVEAGADIDSEAYVGPHCVIAADARVEAGAMIGPGSIIAAGCRIGRDSRLVSRVTLGPNTRIGERAIIQSGAVLGEDGFGFANDGGKWVKIPQVGGVRVGDDVEIGCNTTIDRGALDDTVIEDGVKLDNQIQVAHNVRIGAHTAIAGCTGIAGSAIIGRRCAIGGGVGIVGHIEICDDVQLTGMTYVTHSIDTPGIYSSGVPIEPYKAWRRNYTRIKQLDDMAKRLRTLEKKQDRRINDGE